MFAYFANVGSLRLSIPAWPFKPLFVLRLEWGDVLNNRGEAKE
jgi:hypothetical protein